LLDGGGAYLADLQVPGLAEIAFLRSPVAHGRIRAVEVPPRHRGSVFFAADIAFAKPIVAVGASAGFKYSEYPALCFQQSPLRRRSHRHLRRTHARRGGRHRAILLRRLRGIAGDLGYRRRARPPGATPIHDDWTDNIFAQTRIRDGDLEALRASAPVTVHKRLRMERHAGVSARMPRSSRTAS
jgi:carbon-monoxide dehydrogenase large subunit